MEHPMSDILGDRAEEQRRAEAEATASAETVVSKEVTVAQPAPAAVTGPQPYLGMWWQDPGALPVVTIATPAGAIAVTKDLAREHIRQQAIDAGANPATLVVKVIEFPGT